MRVVVCIFILMSMCSCSATREMQSAAMASQAAAYTAYYQHYDNQPLSVVTLPDGTRIETAHPVRPAAPVITMPQSEWAGVVTSALNSNAVSLFGGAYLAKQVGEFLGGKTFAAGGDISYTVDSGNSLETVDVAGEDTVYDRSTTDAPVTDSHDNNSIQGAPNE